MAKLRCFRMSLSSLERFFQFFADWLVAGFRADFQPERVVSSQRGASRSAHIPTRRSLCCASTDEVPIAASSSFALATALSRLQARANVKPTARIVFFPRAGAGGGEMSGQGSPKIVK
jgi:hypothetical protein